MKWSFWDHPHPKPYLWLEQKLLLNKKTGEPSIYFKDYDLVISTSFCWILWRHVECQVINVLAEWLYSLGKGRRGNKYLHPFMPCDDRDGSAKMELHYELNRQ
jgi:hypothetical protein